MTSRQTPLWLDAPRTPRPALAKKIKADVVIIGAGITAACLAFFLSKRKVRAVILEEDLVASGATGRNGGFLLAGTSHHYAQAREVYGAAKAKLLWELSLENHDLFRRMIDAGKIACEDRHDGSHFYALTAEEAGIIEQSVRDLNADGFPARLVAPPAPFAGGSHQPYDGRIHPVKFVRALLDGSGAQIYENSRVTRVEGGLVSTEGGQVDARAVVFATNAYAPLLAPFFAKVIVATRGQVLLTAPAARGLIPLPVYADYGYQYFRQLEDGRVLIGGGRNTSFNTALTYAEDLEPNVQEFIEDFLGRHYPSLKGIAVERRWAGIMGFTPDGLPAVGPIPGGLGPWYACAGYSGHGLSFAAVCSRMLVEMILDGKAPHGALFDPARFSASRLPGT